jgi:hypothetical protein
MLRHFQLLPNPPRRLASRRSAGRTSSADAFGAAERGPSSTVSEVSEVSARCTFPVRTCGPFPVALPVTGAESADVSVVVAPTSLWGEIWGEI